MPARIRTPAAALPSADPRLALLLALLAAWGGWFIYRTSFVLDGQRFFCLFDDAMITMAYARNWVEGHGLNWGRFGPPVEGYTHPLWGAWMSLLHLLPVPLRLQSLLVQLTSLAILCANVAAVHHLVARHYATPRAAHAMPAAILTACYYPLDHWALQGMETGLQALLVTWAVTLALDTVHTGRRRDGWLFGVLAASLLLRMDMAIGVATVLAYLVLGGGLPWREARRWLPPALAGLALLLGYEAFRRLYFGEWLPNTYYLKLTGVPLAVRLLRGAHVGAGFLAVAGVPVVAALAGTLPLLRARPKLALPFAFVVLQLVYSVYTGGDAWDKTWLAANRFQALAMPMVFVLIGALLNLALDAAGRRGLRLPHLALLVPVTLACALFSNGLWLSERSARRWADVLVTERPFNTEKRERITGEIRALAAQVSPEATVATVWAGIPAYFSDFRMLDTLGYNDRHIAHLPAVNGVDIDHTSYFWPGHIKWDYEWTYGVMRPDVIFQTWPPSGRGVPARMQRYGFVQAGAVWVRPDSPHLRRP